MTAGGEYRLTIRELPIPVTMGVFYCFSSPTMLYYNKFDEQIYWRKKLTYYEVVKRYNVFQNIVLDTKVISFDLITDTVQGEKSNL